MAKLDHTILWCSDKHRSAEFLTSVLGLGPGRTFMHFLIINLANDVSIDLMETDEPIALQHCAFLVSDEEFDRGLEELKRRENTIWADPARSVKGEINHHFGGRGVYFEDPDGHLFELITTPYEIS